MELLYKYYSNASEYAFDNVEKEIIYFTPIESLNDPFEGIGDYVSTIAPEAKIFWDSVSPDTPNIISEKGSKLIYDIVNFRYRIFSSSKDYNNPLLWAHYANSHKGFCVGYNKSDIENLSYKVSDINYSKKLPTFNKIEEKTFMELLYTKSYDWCYENECRALYELKEDDVEHFPYQMYYDMLVRKNEGHINNYIFQIRGTAQTPIHETLCSLKRICCKCKPVKIYLGLRIEAKDRKRLIKIADKLNIEIYQMRKSQHSFDLIPEDIEPELRNLILQTSQTLN